MKFKKLIFAGILISALTISLGIFANENLHSTNFVKVEMKVNEDGSVESIYNTNSDKTIKPKGITTDFVPIYSISKWGNDEISIVVEDAPTDGKVFLEMISAVGATLASSGEISYTEGEIWATAPAGVFPIDHYVRANATVAGDYTFYLTW